CSLLLQWSVLRRVPREAGRMIDARHQMVESFQQRKRQSVLLGLADGIAEGLLDFQRSSGLEVLKRRDAMAWRSRPHVFTRAADCLYRLMLGRIQNCTQRQRRSPVDQGDTLRSRQRSDLANEAHQ